MSGIVKIHAPTSLAIYGPTQCGKTSFVINLLKEADLLFTRPVEEIYYCYESYQDCYDDLKKQSNDRSGGGGGGVTTTAKKVFFHRGMPDIETCRQWSFMKNHIVIVFDDLMTDLSNHADMVKFATIDCHHRNITMMLMLHNIFPPGLRTVSLNIHYIVLFKNKRDSLQVETLGRRIMRSRAKYFYKCFEDAVKKRFGYLFIDMHPHSDETYQLRTCILPSQAPTIIYRPQ